MKFSYVLAFCMLFLSGCGWIIDDIKGEDPRYFVKYLENNETLQEFTFMQTATAYEETNKVEPKFWQVTGKIYIKVPSKFANGYTTKLIGNTRYTGGGSGKERVDKNHIVINLDTGQNANFINEWQDAKSIKIYEFGGGIAETIVYNSKTSVCKDFLSGKPVRTKAVTNYYRPNSTEFFTTITEADMMKNDKIKLHRIDYQFFVTTDKDEIIKVAKSQEFREKMIDADLLKQNRILINSICRKMEK